MKIKTLENRLIDLEMEGIFDKNLSLYLLDIPAEKDLQKGINITPSQNEFFVFAKGYNDLLKVGTVFSSIISRNSTIESIYVTSILKFVSMRKGDNVDYIARGYSAICLLEFPNGIPQILNKLPFYGERENGKKYDSFVISQKEALDEILNYFE